MGRKLNFDRVVEKLRCGHYGRTCKADYSNLGVVIFDENRFADNLGVSKKFLYEIGLLKIGNNAGWNICLVPDYKELINQKDKIIKEVENGNNRKL